MVSQRGFSLIELMIVLALLGFLLMLAVPFTNTWSANAKLRDAENLLQQGVGRVKALAQRNALGISGSEKVAARLCLDRATAKLELYPADTCSGTTAWSAQLPTVVSIKNGGTLFSCLAMSNRGLPVVTGNCNIKSEYTLSTGDENVKVTLH